MITVFSFGGGQQSVYMLMRFIKDPEFRKKHVRGQLIIVGSNTGEEHDHTTDAVEYCRQMCNLHGIFFEWVSPDQGFHGNTWQSLSAQYQRNSTIGSAAFKQTCTENLKINVVDRYVEHLLQYWGYDGRNKKAYRVYAQKHGKIRLILGFAKGEEHRIRHGNDKDPVWKKNTMERYYPLIEDGIDRQECIDYNEQHAPIKIWPSNCMICFYQSDQEVLWLYRNRPDVFDRWVKMEAAKLQKNIDHPKNLAVYGKITLLEKLEKAQRLYGHWSDDQLNEYKFSHGHCIKSTY